MSPWQHSWESKGINKIEVLSLGLANLEGEALGSKNLIDSPKGNLFYSLDQNIPLSVDRPKNKFINRGQLVRSFRSVNMLF